MPQLQEKIGLALSGGGLRASFFHIGLMAQMAEQGILKSVSVISTVSGGSIIGALYYLHLKNLLESKTDQDITDQDYIEIIKTIEADFLEATEKNIRMNVLSDVRKNFHMRKADYSRSTRISELYNDYLYQKVADNLGNPVELKNLKIQPLEGPESFHPDEHNGKRTAKVPILVINSTTLNGARNWQFTAKTMGEHPSRDSSIDIDKKPIRLRRAKKGYSDLIKPLQGFSLGHAVAASACVPGLFDPLAINDLYYDKINSEKIVPQLVDGGVFDNQGIISLLEQNCSQFIVSDASGQMGMENEIDTSPVSVLLRVTSVFQDRIRTESLLHLIDSKGEQNIAFINLRKGLEEREISWKDKNNQAGDDIIFPSTCQEFGVDPTVQKRLSLMRTDLDAFTEVEAYSLMLDAYQMSKQELIKFRQTDQPSENDSTWQFSQMAEFMKNPKPDYLKQLDVSQAVFGKALQVFPWLWALIILVIGAIIYYAWQPIIEPALNSSFTVYAVLVAIALWAATILAPKFEHIISVLHNLRPQAVLLQRLGKACLLVILTLIVTLYLKFINPMYLDYGRVDKLKK